MGVRGVPAVLNRLKDLKKDSPTVNGKSIREIAEEGKVMDDDVIRAMDNAYFSEGGILKHQTRHHPPHSWVLYLSNYLSFFFS